MDNWGFVMAGYMATAVALGGYVAALFARARRARLRSAAIAGKVRGDTSPAP